MQISYSCLLLVRSITDSTGVSERQIGVQINVKLQIFKEYTSLSNSLIQATVRSLPETHDHNNAGECVDDKHKKEN